MIALYGFIGGALWRMVLGGMWNVRRSIVFAVSPLLIAPLFLLMPWQDALIVGGLVTASWVMGHDYAKPWGLTFAVRYWSAPALVMAYMTWFAGQPEWVSYGLVGPLISLGYWVAQIPVFIDWVYRKNWRLIDGSIRLAEGWAGAWVFGSPSLLSVF